jgi:RHS repeat-associated protein
LADPDVPRYVGWLRLVDAVDDARPDRWGARVIQGGGRRILPGQYYLPETGLYYNYYRTYDPQTGRYLESDPVGLRAGVNTYAYVRANPISRSDRFGLDDSICMFNPGMCGMQHNADPNEPSAAAEIIAAEGAITAALIVPEILPALERALGLNPKGLPPQGVKPPTAGQCEAAPSTRGDDSSLWDPNGGEWRFAPEDQWRNPHWDYNPWDNWNSPWQNVPIDGLPPVKGPW